MILDVILMVLFVAILVLLILMRKQLASIDKSQAAQEALNSLRETVSRSEREIRDAVQSSQSTISNTLTTQLQSTGEMLGSSLTELGKAQTRELENVTKSTNNLTQTNEARIENVRKTIDGRLKDLQDSNERRLDQIRETVDEQLQSTLEKRLNESFNLVSERLEAVQHGLGTMQELASGVGNLQRVLTNVSKRGTWAEYQLGSILEEILTPDQYDTNVRPHPGSEIVEYAIRLPGQRSGSNSRVYLPIDSKFPTEDYQRLLDAAERADKDAEQKAVGSLTRTIHNEAQKISQRYIVPPHTTDFAIMFLATEGLYAEILRQPGQVEKLLHDHKIIVAGPVNLAAILSSLRVGFQTLAIQKHSGKIQDTLTAVKTEFREYSRLLGLTQRHLRNASNALEKTEERSQAVVDKLQEVEELPLEEAAKTLGLPKTELGNELSE